MSYRPHIVHVIGSPHAGGVQQLVLGFADCPALERFQQSVVAVRSPSGEWHGAYAARRMPEAFCRFDLVDPDRIPSYRIGRAVRDVLERTFPARFARLLCSMGADLVHTHVSPRIDLQADAVIRRCALPFVWTIHGLLRPQGPELQRWLRAARLAHGHRATITAVSEEAAEDFRVRGVDGAEAPMVVHAGADIARVKQHPGPGSAFRSTSGVPRDAILYGSAGRLAPEKAQAILLAATAEAAALNPRIHVILAGSGPLHDDLASRARQLGVADRFHLAGYVADVAGFLKGLDVYVLPSRSEGCPLSMIEALAAGLPCIGSRVGEVPAMLGDGAGVVVEPGNVAELAEAMLRMADPATRARHASHAPAAAERYTIDACAQRFAAIYEGLLTEDNRMRPGPDVRTTGSDGGAS